MRRRHEFLIFLELIFYLNKLFGHIKHRRLVIANDKAVLYVMFFIRHALPLQNLTITLSMG